MVDLRVRKLVVACRWKSGPGSCQEARERCRRSKVGFVSEAAATAPRLEGVKIITPAAAVAVLFLGRRRASACRGGGRRGRGRWRGRWRWRHTEGCRGRRRTRGVLWRRGPRGLRF